MIRLRGHHLFCTALFYGNGYSEAFVKRMEEILLRMEEESVYLINEADEACEKCPNKRVDGICMLGNEDVCGKDRGVAEALQFAFEKEYTPGQIKQAMKNVTKEDFERICGTCRWCKEGYCSYEKMKRK